MPRTRLRTALAVTLLVGGSTAFAVTSVEPVTAHAHDEGEDGHAGHGALDEAMNGLKDELRKLAASIGDPAADEQTLASLSVMQGLALSAKPLDPSNLSSVPAGERDAHRVDYRRDMARLLRELADMEILVLDGKHAEAKERIKPGLVELRNSAHDKFQEK